jgi:rRNA-processing protein FCF1
MQQVILDTSFILTCIKQKIDFFEELSFKGLEILIPDKVLAELEGLAKQNPSSKLALKIIGSNKFTEITIKSKKVDQGIINYAKANPPVILATLDEEIKKRTKNPKLVVRGRKKLEVL